MKNKTLNISKKLTTLLILFFAVSCSNSKGWVYKPNNYNNESGYSERNNLKDKTISVLPFVDKRTGDDKNYAALDLIPLVPFGFQDFSSPETSPVHLNSGLWVNFNPKDDFAKAMVDELTNAGIGKEILFSSSAKDSDYHVKGEIISTRYEGKIFSYGLSIYGPILWVALPATTVSNDLEVTLSLINSKSKDVIFTKTYKADNYYKVGWIYGLPNDFYYPEMLRISYQQFVKDITNLGKL